jgi:MoaE-MoaD fusion protein
MRVRVRFFAFQRLQTGLREHDLSLPEGATVEAAWEAIVAAFPQLAEAGESVRYARNGAYVEVSERLADGDELAVIPPVAGGSFGDPARHRRVEIVPGPLGQAHVADLLATLPTEADGAVAVFVGRTRATPGTPAPGQEAEAARFAGQRVVGLAYEAYAEMAVSVLEGIAQEVEDRFGVRRLAILHRVGEVAVGETSVVIVAAAAHREEAFAACRYAIEELKARAPIWKAERFADGSVWLGAPARSGPTD